MIREHGHIPSQEAPNHDPTEPLYPLLDPYELGDVQDRRSEVRPEVASQLAPEDVVIEIITPELRPLRQTPSALREIMRIAGVTSMRDIGITGGPVASRASHENEQVEALRKFEVLHGRDALEIGLKLYDHYPKLLEATLFELAATQGVTDEQYVPGQPFRQEELGRIMLLDRHPDDPVGKKFTRRLGWGWPFYGSIDATPTFVSAVARHAAANPSFLDRQYTSRDGERTIKEALDRSVTWIIAKLDETPHGLVEFRNKAEKGGMDSQSWKDSAFAYVHADGSRANMKDGIASVEVQALAYDALLDAADLYGESSPEVAAELRRYATDLRKKIFQTFWVEDEAKGRFFVLGTDHDPTTGELRQLAVRTSNMGRLLNSRLLEGNDPQTTEVRESTIYQLFTPELLAYSGIRTLARDEQAFRPGGYHTGSVWSWDTEYIATGLERHNYHHLAWNLRERIWRTSQETGAFPEFTRGGTRMRPETNPSEIYVWNKKYEVLHLFEQPPQEIQGWTVSAILAAKHAYPAYVRNRSTLPSPFIERVILQDIQRREGNLY
ncbi:amylo-alpha-1,6-glucosidase [Streptomyces caniscabiei]|uniref:amylo-alpha-1,6-glucosidase n=1 Tax=Streptomyces caniscabiei TaxID=2746961 RepID=UPI0029BAB395|nr:amylo-alpha-1,6-glucosidase [Streptomyces caniscabiei]MDX2775778.1 amylo-alpha-1,6-glucosidase [Streptomyces caniscabiei]